MPIGLNVKAKFLTLFIFLLCQNSVTKNLPPPSKKGEERREISGIVADNGDD
jgi:hypothetical protein